MSWKCKTYKAICLRAINGTNFHPNNEYQINVYDHPVLSHRHVHSCSDPDDFQGLSCIYDKYGTRKFEDDWKIIKDISR